MDDPEAVLIAEITEAGLLDADWYLACHADVAAAGLDALPHFARFGMRELRAPNRYFDLGWYAAENPDVTAAELSPFLHYARHGDLEGRKPHPLVDPAWYRRAYDLDATVPALSHFLAHRDSARLAPGPDLVAVTLMPRWFGARAVDRYLDEADGIASSRLAGGLAGGMAATQTDVLPDPAIVADSQLLDPNHYLINASDVHQSGMDPVRHYCAFGWRENRHPNVYFDPEWYIATNPDLARRPMNPLVHYVLLGEPAGRRPVPYFDPAWYRATYPVPDGTTALAHYLAHRRTQTVSPNPVFDVAWYVERHRDSLGPNRDPFAHYLLTGTTSDVDPSPGFDARRYRRRFLGRPSRAFGRLMSPNLYNPLVHLLRSQYR